MRSALCRLPLLLFLTSCNKTDPTNDLGAINDAPRVIQDRWELPQFPRIAIFPTNGQTATGSQNPSVFFDMPIGAAAADLVAKGLTLLTWPELDPVQSHPSKASGDLALPYGRVHLVPDQSLSDRWYIFKVAAVPGFHWYSTPDHIFADGAHGSRFRTGSEPHLWRVEVCGKPDTYAISVAFTESLIATQSIETIITLKQAGKTLTLTIPPNQFTAPSGGASLYLNASIDKNQPLDIILNSGLESPSGVPLVLAASPVTLHLPDLPITGSGCVGKYMFP